MIFDKVSDRETTNKNDDISLDCVHSFVNNSHDNSSVFDNSDTSISSEN